MTNTDNRQEQSDSVDNDDSNEETNSTARQRSERRDVETGLGNSEAAAPTEQHPEAAPSSCSIEETSQTNTLQPDKASQMSHMMFADAVLVHGDDQSLPTPIGDIPVVEAIYEHEGENNCAETVRLDSSHIVSIRNHTNNERPEFASVILANRSSYGDFGSSKDILGISLYKTGNGELVISKIDQSSPFLVTSMQVGDVLISINNTTCKDMEPDSALAALLSSVTSNQPTTTIRLHNVGGASSRVVTTVEKTTPDTQLGITLKVNARGSVIISSISPNKVLANSLLNPRDRIISVNGNDCATVSAGTNDVVRWIQEAQKFVTIVTETTMSTGVVIATGNTPAANNNNTRGPQAQSPEADKSKLFLFLGIIMIIVIIAAGVSVSQRMEDDDDDDYFSTPSSPTFPTPSFPTFPTVSPPILLPDEVCDTATAIPTDGSVVFGSIEESSSFGSLTCSNLANSGGGVWFKLTVMETRELQVSTCSFNSADTVLAVYKGRCQSLECIDVNDDGGFACGTSSLVSFLAVSGETYYILVQGYSGTTGGFGIKAESRSRGLACLCWDSYFTPPPSSSFYPTWSSDPPLAQFEPSDYPTLSPST